MTLLCHQWTAAGDAFKIGADLNLLESETLPKYFRHSRFQSLVRQLNFYNFRKVNRERTFWIYKHRLFHRDHPEDLHLLRRRTCPGVDGRKNRFSTFSRKVSEDSEQQQESFGPQNGTSDDSSLEHEEATEQHSRKRRASGTGRDDDSKRRGGNRGARVSIERKPENKLVVDLSLVASSPRPLPASKFINDGDSGSENEIDERIALREQAHVVSQVALKLEEYARKAKRSLGRTRGGGGIVTPPLGGGRLPSGHYYRSLITYDDEYEAMTADPSSDRAFVVPDDLNVVSPSPPKAVKRFYNSQVPVESAQLIKAVCDRIMASGSDTATNTASAGIASFCMSNAPDESESEACAKILGLLSTCDKLANEFMQYRYALHPLESSSTTSYSTFCAPGFRNDSTAFSINQIWERAASRRDAVRDFKTFAVNYINSDLLRIDFPKEEGAALHITSDYWSKSASINA